MKERFVSKNGIGRRIMALVLTFVMVLAMLPSMSITAKAAGAPVEVSSWDELVSALNDGGNYVLTADVAAATSSTKLTVPSGKTVFLDLNGHTIDASGKFTVITVKGSLTVDDKSDTKTGTITGGKATAGAGVYIDATGAFYLEGGIISGNEATSGAGGGVANLGTFVMNGGYIKNNTAYSAAGGIFTVSNNTSLLGGIITGNKTTKGDSTGAGVSASNAAVTVGGNVKISRNKANGVESNLYLRPGDSNKLIISTTVPLEYAYIGIASATNTIPDCTATAGVEKWFFSDNEAYQVNVVSGKLVLEPFSIGSEPIYAQIKNDSDSFDVRFVYSIPVSVYDADAASAIGIHCKCLDTGVEEDLLGYVVFNKIKAGNVTVEDPEKYYVVVEITGVPENTAFEVQTMMTYKGDVLEPEYGTKYTYTTPLLVELTED